MGWVRVGVGVRVSVGVGCVPQAAVVSEQQHHRGRRARVGDKEQVGVEGAEVADAAAQLRLAAETAVRAGAALVRPPGLGRGRGRVRVTVRARA